jgi:PPOX class probable F420-dependent enzyme
MGESLTGVQRYFQAPVFVVVSTINPDGQPQSSVVWAKVEDDQVIISTIRGRRKCRNLERDPRATLIAYNPENPYHYTELRGSVTLAETGGDELINELSLAYTGKPFNHPPGQVRVVVRFTADKVFEYLDD